MKAGARKLGREKSTCDQRTHLSERRGWGGGGGGGMEKMRAARNSEGGGK